MARMLAATEWRSNWRSLLVVALITGLAGALTAGSLAASRRAATSFDRFLEIAAYPTVYVDPETPPTDELLHRIAAVPGVEMAAQLSLMLVAPDLDGLRPGLTMLGGVVVRSAGSRTWTDRVVEGRIADPADPDEITINEEMRDRHGLSVGQRLTLISLTPEQLELSFTRGISQGRPGGPRVAVRIVGVTRSPEDISDTREPLVMLTPAFHQRYESSIASLNTIGIHAGSSRDPNLAAQLERIVDGDGRASVDDFSGRIRGALGVQVTGLRVLAVLAALAGLLALVQAMSRHMAPGRQRRSALRALGATDAQLVLAQAGAFVPVAALAATLTGGGSVLVAPLLISGKASLAEPDPGPWLDPVVAVGGAVLVAAVVLVAGSLLAAGLLRFGRRAPSPRAWTPSLWPRLTRALPLSASVGTHLAVPQNGTRTQTTSVLSFMAAIAGVAGIVGAAAFATEAVTLLNTPRLYGAAFDADSDALDDNTVTPAQAQQSMYDRAAVLAGRAQVAAVSVVEEAPLSIVGRAGRQDVTIETVDPIDGSIPPVIGQGRVPMGPDEVALGAGIARTLGVSVGDSVVAGPGRIRWAVVGTYVLADGNYSDQRGYVDRSSFRRVVTDPGRTSLRLRFAGGTSLEDGVAAVQDQITAVPVGTPSTVANLRELGRVPVVLGVFVGVLALAASWHTLVTTVRRRQKDLAVLRALGFVRRQVRAALCWQSLTITLAGLVAGVPLGLGIGRQLWHVMTDRLGVVFEPVVPWVVLAGLIPGSVVLAVLIALPAGALAARNTPAEVLRGE